MNPGVDADKPVLKRTELGLSTPYCQPKIEAEQSVAEIWQAVLNVDQIGIEDDFFEIGGDSLAATILASVLESQTGVKFSPSDIIEYSTVARQAVFLELQRNERSRPVNTLPSYLNLFNSSGTKKPLFVIHGGSGFTLYGKNFLDGLGRDQPVGFIEAPGLDGKGPRFKSIKEYAECYLDAIRRAAPEGEWQIAANCLGGIIAIEMCLQAEKQGERVSRLILIDPPNLREKHLKNQRKKIRSFIRDKFRSTWLKTRRFRHINVTGCNTSGAVSDVSVDYDEEAAAYDEEIERRAKLQENFDKNVSRRLKGTVPSRITYNTEAMRLVSHDLHAAILEYEFHKWYGNAFLLACRDRSRNLKFWKRCLPNIQFQTAKDFDHYGVFHDGLPLMLAFLRNAMSENTR